MTSEIITLTTDFGGSDGYVAQMKGVILGINRRASVVDVTHEIPPQDVFRASVVLDQSVDAFPPGTIHVVVVDPGVGSERRMVALVAGGQRFVAPDNGVLSRIVRRFPPEAVVALTERRYWRPEVSSTFHGRDVMAPVAAHWSLGVEFTKLGDTLQEPLVVLPGPEPVRKGSALVGEVLSVDRFGNLVTNIAGGDLPLENASRLSVEIGPELISGVVRCYAEVSDGALVALIGSHGQLEVAVNRGSAAERLRVSPGDEVRVLGMPI